MLKKLKPLAVSILIPLTIGIISSIITANSRNIYENNQKPEFSPPEIVFPIVWTILYILMGISSYLVYKKINLKHTEVTKALTVYAISLFFNFFWSIIFFKARLFTFAFIWLLILIATVFLTVKQYFNISKIASCLQIPYLIWTVFAAYLNFAVIN